MRITALLLHPTPDRPMWWAEVTDLDDDPDRVVEVELDIEGDQLTPIAVTVRRRGNEAVTSSDLRVPLETYLEQVRQHPALTSEGQWRMRPKRKRRQVTDAFLRQVAERYLSTPEGQRIATLVAEHSASESQIYRWLRTARQRGILTDERTDDGER